jgi:hypothetical protein
LRTFVLQNKTGVIARKWAKAEIKASQSGKVSPAKKVRPSLPGGQ